MWTSQLHFHPKPDIAKIVVNVLALISAISPHERHLGQLDCESLCRVDAKRTRAG